MSNEVHDREMIAARLREARAKAGFVDATEAAKKFNWNENTYRSHENGNRGIKPAVLGKYALRFRVDVIWLLTGKGDAPFRRIVEVAGYVFAAGSVLPESAPDLDRYAELPFECPDAAVCYIVKTDALQPRYADGDLLVCWGKLDRDPVALEGIAVTANDTLLGRIYPNGSNFDLEILGGKSRRNIPVSAFAPIRVVIRETLYTERMARVYDE